MAADSFPIKCTSCGKEHSEASWKKLYKVGVQKVPAGDDPKTEPAYELELRNCKCKSTIARELPAEGGLGGDVLVLEGLTGDRDEDEEFERTRQKMQQDLDPAALVTVRPSVNKLTRSQFEQVLQLLSVSTDLEEKQRAVAKSRNRANYQRKWGDEENAANETTTLRRRSIDLMRLTQAREDITAALEQSVGLPVEEILQIATAQHPELGLPRRALPPNTDESDLGALLPKRGGRKGNARRFAQQDRDLDRQQRRAQQPLELSDLANAGQSDRDFRGVYAEDAFDADHARRLQRALRLRYGWEVESAAFAVMGGDDWYSHVHGMPVGQVLARFNRAVSEVGQLEGLGDAGLGITDDRLASTLAQEVWNSQFGQAQLQMFVKFWHPGVSEDEIRGDWWRTLHHALDIDPDDAPAEYPWRARAAAVEELTRLTLVELRGDEPVSGLSGGRNGRNSSYSVREVERQLRDAGFYEARRNGSHAIWKGPNNQTVVLPGVRSGQAVSKNVLRNIKRAVEAAGTPWVLDGLAAAPDGLGVYFPKKGKDRKGKKFNVDANGVERDMDDPEDRRAFFASFRTEVSDNDRPRFWQEWHEGTTPGSIWRGDPNDPIQKEGLWQGYPRSRVPEAGLAWEEEQRKKEAARQKEIEEKLRKEGGYDPRGSDGMGYFGGFAGYEEHVDAVFVAAEDGDWDRAERHLNSAIDNGYPEATARKLWAQLQAQYA